MATYTFRGYQLGSFDTSTGSIFVSPGDSVWIDPTFDNDTDYIELVINDDDGTFDSDGSNDEIGNDGTQTGTVTDAGGGTLGSGNVYIEDRVVLSDGNGNTIEAFTVEVDGVLVGVVTVPEMVPGTTYEVVSYSDPETTGDTPTYAEFSDPTYDYDDAQTYQGGAYNDTFQTGGGNDVIYGSGGDDTISGEGGEDQIHGDAGNDNISGGSGNDQIWGGTGNDTLTGGSGADNLRGDDGNDVFNVYSTDEFTDIDGGSGYDQVSFIEVTDQGGVTLTAIGTDGFTYSFNGTGANGTVNQVEQFNGSAGSDTFNVSADSNGGIYTMWEGDDTFTGGAASETVWAGEGNDTLNMGAGNDTAYGDEGDDRITGGSGDDTLYGGSGFDTFYFANGWGNDTVDGGTGAGEVNEDTLDFSAVTSGPITVTFSGPEDGTATDGTNTVDFSNIEHIVGSGQNDTINASSDNSGLILEGGGGADQITGGSGDDFLYGGDGADTINAGAGNDVVDGGAGDDTISGSLGDDTITGGTGNDLISTGGGNDTLVLRDGDGNDTITDFDMGDDDLDGFTNDQLDVSSLTNALGDPITTEDVVVTDDGSGNAVLTFPDGTSIRLQGVTVAEADEGTELYAMGIPCYATGTRIMTPAGEVAIEDLRAGEMVSTVDRGPQPLLWAGHTRVGRSRMAQDPALAPIRIRDGTFGNRGDLLVSPQHGVVLPSSAGQKLVRATHLARFGNGRVRVARGVREVGYHHLLLPVHALVIANGMPSESLYPGAYALAGFDRAAKAELFGLFPALETVLTRGLTGQTRHEVSAKLYGATALPFARAHTVAKGQIALGPAAPEAFKRATALHGSAAQRSRISGQWSETSGS